MYALFNKLDIKYMHIFYEKETMKDINVLKQKIDVYFCFKFFIK